MFASYRRIRKATLQVPKMKWQHPHRKPPPRKISASLEIPISNRTTASESQLSSRDLELWVAVQGVKALEICIISRKNYGHRRWIIFVKTATSLWLIFQKLAGKLKDLELAWNRRYLRTIAPREIIPGLGMTEVDEGRTKLVLWKALQKAIVVSNRKEVSSICTQLQVNTNTPFS